MDSIQTLYSPELSGAPGGVGQVRECAARLMRLAKSEGIAVVLVGHVTKEGSIAGPRVLEHMVDTVLQFEGDRFQSFRVLRALKNRFGSTNEVGVFEMTGRGMVEVEDPSAFFLSRREEEVPPGVVTVCLLEGTRPMLVEIESLVAPSPLANPRRIANGVDTGQGQHALRGVEQEGWSRATRSGRVRQRHRAVCGSRSRRPTSGWRWPSLQRCGTDPWARVLPVSARSGSRGTCATSRGAQRRTSEMAKLGFGRIIRPEGTSDGPPRQPKRRASWK